jgi:hypothetical protein
MPKEEAIKAFESDDSSNSSSGSSSDSDDSSSTSSQFGFGAKTEDAPSRRILKKTNPKAVATAPKDKTPGSSSKEKPPNSSPRAAPTEKKARTAEAPKLTEALQLSKSLDQVTVASIWKGTLKPKEIQSRLSKATTCAGELELEAETNMGQDEKLKSQKLVHELNETANSITIMQEIAKKVHSEQALSLVRDECFAKHFKHVLKSLDFDTGTLSAILVHLGQNLMEAWFWRLVFWSIAHNFKIVEL